MELRQYWNVIWKRKWLVLAIVLVATAVSAFLAFTADRTFETEVKFITRQDPTVDTSPQYFTFDRYYNWFSSEFLVDDYTQIVTSDAFAQSVLSTTREAWFANQVIEDWNNQLKAEGKPGDILALRGAEASDKLRVALSGLTVQAVKGAIEADRRHRELRMTITAGDPDVAKAIADASAIVLADAKMEPIRGEMVNDRGVFAQIGRAGPDNIASNRGKEIVNAITRVIMGIVAALALAFLLEYLDTSVRDEKDVRRVLDLPVLGSIPKA